MHACDRLETYDYELPPELIAQEPLPARDASRLLVVRRADDGLSHRSIRELSDLLEPGDCLVLNNSRVLPARLLGLRTKTGGKWEGLFLSTNSSGQWRLIGQTRGWIHVGETVTIAAPESQDTAPLGSGSDSGWHVPESSKGVAWEQRPRPSQSLRDVPPEFSHALPLVLRLMDREPDGVWVMEPVPAPSSDEGNISDARSTHRPLELLARYGSLPLPPYIERSATEADADRYQTAYATRPGSVAAPTAGLHFTPELLERCRARGIETAFVTLHVGIGTFRPVSVADLAQHVMHAEFCELSAETARQLANVRRRGRRIVAVGTTSLRTLEAAWQQTSGEAWSGETKLFIRPPYEFQAVDALLTNFHLPKSTLLMLVSALAGIDLIRAAYAAAIAERYRFFSYGDAMLIV